MKLTAKQVYEKLLESGILTFRGNIKFCFGGIDVTVSQKDPVGTILQEWLQKWFEHEKIDYRLAKSTQMPPDFYLDPDDDEHHLLEVKAFNYNGNPGFDIGDFTMYASELLKKPYMLDADYLIFGYIMDKTTGDLMIKQLWLKKVWQITRRADDYPINLQVKKKKIHKIRPGIWYRDNTDDLDFSLFTSIEDFISAIEETLQRGSAQMNGINVLKWKSLFIKKYKEVYGKKLDIPRWNEIEDKYDLRPAHAIAKATTERDKTQNSVNKINERITKCENKLAKARTEKQREAAEASLIKAQEALSKATAKLTETQAVLDKLLEDSNL